MRKRFDSSQLHQTSLRIVREAKSAAPKLSCKGGQTIWSKYSEAASWHVSGKCRRRRGNIVYGYYCFVHSGQYGYRNRNCSDSVLPDFPEAKTVSRHSLPWVLPGGSLLLNHEHGRFRLEAEEKTAFSRRTSVRYRPLTSKPCS